LRGASDTAERSGVKVMVRSRPVFIVQAAIMGRGVPRRKHKARRHNRAWRTAPLRDLAIAARRTATLAAP